MKGFRFFITILFFVFIHFNLQAFDWAAQKITVIKSQTEQTDPGSKPRTIETLKDEKGNIFNISFFDIIEENTAKRILDLNKKFFNWKHIKINFVRYVVSEDRVEIIIIPQKITYLEVDYLPYIPAGMLLIDTDTLTYIFRMKIKGLFIKIKGEFITEEVICGKMAEAIKNPRAYVRKRDPEYFLRKLEQLEVSIDKLKANHGALKDKLSYGMITLHNKSFFGGLNLVKKEAIEKIIKLKTEKPSMTKDQLAAKLKEEKIEVSSSEIELILAVYFNEFK